ncbi:MAG TPA: DUF1801 domain-containing protein [Steroidobacteraceae bacterium]|nr:DUF1801 domain-containing protein [Steroidobacteraceae bacterium]
MAAARARKKSIDAYIKACSPAVRPTLRKLRATIRRAASPDAQEMISYRMPAFARHGMLVYFAAFKNHIGLYPPVRGNAQLEAAVAKYAGPKGNLQFPLDQAIPYALIARIVRLRLKQNLDKAKSKRKKPAVARA